MMKSERRRKVVERGSVTPRAERIKGTSLGAGGEVAFLVISGKNMISSKGSAGCWERRGRGTRPVELVAGSNEHLQAC